MDLLVGIIILLLFIGLGVGAYFLFFKKSDKTCSKVSHGTADPKNNCAITCDTDYDLSSDGKKCEKKKTPTPKTDKCPANCSDTSCPEDDLNNNICKNCKNGYVPSFLGYCLSTSDAKNTCPIKDIPLNGGVLDKKCNSRSYAVLEENTSSDQDVFHCTVTNGSKKTIYRCNNGTLTSTSQ